MKAVLIISHGSHSKKLIIEIRELVEKIKLRSEYEIVNYAFLEITEPDISTGIDECVQQGANEIRIVLNFLNSGRHVDEDIPKIVSEAHKKYPNIPITISDPLGKQEGIIDLFIDMM